MEISRSVLEKKKWPLKICIVIEQSQYRNKCNNSLACSVLPKIRDSPHWFVIVCLVQVTPHYSRPQGAEETDSAASA